MPARSALDSGHYTRARALRRLAPLLLERDVLERFLARASALVPAGDVTLAISARDGAYAGTFSSLRDLAADPELATRLSDVHVSLLRTEAGRVTHELHLQDADGRATLLALGEEVWAFGALGVLAELLAVYAKPQAAFVPEPLRTFEYFSGGFALALAFVASVLRGGPAAGAAALICGAVWFLMDMGLSEIRLALTPPAPKPLTIEIRTQRETRDRRRTLVRAWLGLRLLMVPVWLCVGYVVLTAVLPHVPKHW